MSKQNNMRSLNWRQRGWRSVVWKNSDVTVEAPADSILHWDADIDAFFELTGGVHSFQHAVLSPQYQRNTDGSYSNVGAKPAVDVFGGEKWLRSCGAVTNLFGGDTSQARSVSLTNGTVYTLHVFGAGTVSCSYGTATVAEPLKITATATESVEFTPDGATYWMLTATDYPVPYVPPGVTQPASNATTTNGCWFSLPDGSPLWHALDGGPETDGVELVMNGGFDSADGWGVGVGWGISSGVATHVGPNYGTLTQLLSLKAGETYAITFNFNYLSGGGLQFGEIGNAAITTLYSGGVYTLKFTSVGSTGILFSGGSVNGSIDNISIQRIQPQPLTLATRVRMGVGSGDLPFNGKFYVFAEKANGTILYGGDWSGAERIAQSYDGANATLQHSSWNRYSAVRYTVQVNTAGTQFRVGYMIEGIHTAIQWSAWTVFDGSFDPSSLYRLMLCYISSSPMWFNKITAWKKQCTDAEILEALS